ncbi:ABC transporter ATP-binding protein [Vallitalea longa]|uniref:ABC transporter ATP-binding protein n=1 Tax=Vallitalea longa TaxID=2936439 RepID=A0A9W6DID5_9FIRM|nr:ABC transporter ATP-binding protein [Vallitalea longa]GKX31789.1 ABC transporter ATP-binding protein [Vallitalea longa]
MSYISLGNVTFAYPNGFVAVDEANININKNENVAIIGQNGAGKTTTVKMFNGLLKPTKGDVLIGDMNTKDYTTAQISRKVGYVFQNPDDQIFHSTVYDEVVFGPRMMKIEKEKLTEIVDYALDITGLSEVSKENPYNLPLSIRKFVTIAAVIAMDTEVMIFDEPTAGQDLVGNKRLASILKELHKKGKTVITISHDMEFVTNNFNRIIVMANKKVVKTGTPKEIFWDFETMDKAMLKQTYVSQLCRKLKIGNNVISIEEAVESIKEIYDRG